MDPAYVLADCPECRGIRTVVMDVCYVCFAEFGERAGETRENDETGDPDELAWQS
ncbi:MAG TPA: hypothetical protein VHM47_03860 [Actinomycetota bacterium]|jgi:hypothetical protein|nr:hypothetical protein [Actinomycetota bacterium]